MRALRVNNLKHPILCKNCYTLCSLLQDVLDFPKKKCMYLGVFHHFRPYIVHIEISKTIYNSEWRDQGSIFEDRGGTPHSSRSNKSPPSCKFPTWSYKNTHLSCKHRGQGAKYAGSCIPRKIGATKLSGCTLPTTEPRCVPNRARIHLKSSPSPIPISESRPSISPSRPPLKLSSRRGTGLVVRAAGYDVLCWPGGHGRG
jgi:hypothetical protein